jgi:dihydrofolate reductase
MAKLIYSTIMSVDGYLADASGNFEWATPDEEVHAFVNDLERPVGTYLYGRAMYETMAIWGTLSTDDAPAVEADFAQLWRAADKIVYSTTLPEVSTPRTQLERVFDTEAVRALKQASTRDLTIGGPTLAAHAIRAGIVDEYQLFVVPHLAGGGTRALPDGAAGALEPRGARRFRGGTVYLDYARPR